VKKSKPRRSWSLLPLVLIVAATLTLLLSNLGNQYLWQDEAQTALIAKTVLAHGVPLATDGRNSFSQELGNDYGPGGIWLWHPWFQFYATAASFALLGVSSFTARLPFALFGAATVVLVYYFGLLLWNSRRAAVLAAVALASSVPFLLLARQCRYYAPEAFFALLALYGYRSLLAGRKHAALTLFLGATFTFHNHYVQCAALLATVMVHALIWHRRRVLRVALVCAAVVAVNSPMIIWFSGMRRAVPVGGALLSETPIVLGWFVKQLFSHVFPPLMLFAAVAVVAVRWAKDKQFPRPEREWTEDVGLLLLFVVLTLLANALIAPGEFFRYLTPVIPVCCLLLALVLESLARLHSILAVAALALLLYLGPMRDYLDEITHDYDGPIEGIVTYLNSHAGPNDLVAITYGDLPVKFYTKLRVLGGLTGEDLSPVRNADWVILRKNVICEKDAAVHDYIRRNVARDGYEPVTIPYPDLPFENREEPDMHQFRTVTDADAVVIFKRSR
jgi:hypothetical protein